MEYNIIINGFHGTDENAAKEIIKTKKFKSQHNEEHWLGQGIYFFREDPDQASSWAREITLKNNRIKKVRMKAIVLKTDITVKSNEYLNLNSRESLFNLKGNIMRSIEESLVSIGYEVDGDKQVFSKKALRCTVLDLIPVEEIKVIQNNFSIPPPKFMNNKIMKEMGLEMHSIQVCVRDESLIDLDSIVTYTEFNVPTKNLHRSKRKSNIIIK